MPRFRYEAVTASGEIETGEIEGASQSEIIDRLHASGSTPIRADIAETRRSAASRLRAKRAKRRGGNLALLSQQLATLLQAGLSLDRSLEITRELLGRRGEGEALGKVLEMVRGGSSLADAMTAQDGTFPDFFVGMVRAGEAGGTLEATLGQIATFLERTQAAREQIKSAMVYPLVVLVTGSASLAILLGFVVPQFRPLFDEAGTRLPLSAQLILALTDFLHDDWWILLTALVLAALLARQQARDPASRGRWHALALRLPLLGDLILKSEIARFARTLGTALRNGVAPLAALTVTGQSLGNLAIRDAVATLADSVKEGRGLAQPLGAIALMPPLLVHLTRIGEETARLDEMLVKAAEIYDEETRRTVERLLAMLVPAITIALGIVVALVIGSILMAMLSVYDLAV